MIKNIAKICRIPPRTALTSALTPAYYQSSLMQSFLDHRYSRLCRYEKPVGCMLLYWPTTWGLAIGAATLPSPAILAMFLMGAWTSRSAGCIINDYFDRSFDRSVERCKDRPLASGEVTVKEAAGLLFANLCGGLYVLTQLPVPALLATFAILPIAALYPLAKRYTRYPQFILGLAFNSGVIIGSLTLSPLLPNWPCTLLIYCSGICWTMVYDTVYAYQDIGDDKKLGLYSTAITWQEDPKKYLNAMMIMSFAFAATTAMVDPSYVYCLPGFVAAYGYLLRLLGRLDLKDRAQCGQFFRRNNYIGVFIFLALTMRGIFSPQNSNP